MPVDYRIGAVAAPDENIGLLSGFNKGVEMRGTMARNKVAELTAGKLEDDINQGRELRSIISDAYKNKPDLTQGELGKLIMPQDYQEGYKLQAAQQAQELAKRKDMESHVDDTNKLIAGGLYSVKTPEDVKNFFDFHNTDRQMGVVHPQTWDTAQANIMGAPDPVAAAKKYSVGTIGALDQMKEEAKAAKEAADLAKEQRDFGLKREEFGFRKEQAKLGEMDPESVDTWANVIAQGGTLPVGMGRNKVAAAQIMKRAGDILSAKAGGDAKAAADAFVLNTINNKSKSESIKTLEKAKNNMQVNEGTVKNSFKILEELNPKLENSDFVPWNKMVNAWQLKTGDPKVVAYGGAINTIVNEFTKVLVGSGQTTDAARAHTEEMLNSAYSYDQLKLVLHTMKQEMDARTESFNETIDEAKAGLVGKKPKSEEKPETALKVGKPYFSPTGDFVGSDGQVIKLKKKGGN